MRRELFETLEYWNNGCMTLGIKFEGGHEVVKRDEMKFSKKISKSSGP